jgi:SAM-dependent methyltransferase
MIEQARHYCGNVENIEFVHGDAAHYKPEDQFDGYFSFRVIEYIDGWQDVLMRVAEHVASGGSAVICTKTPVSVYRGTGRERWFTTGIKRRGQRLQRLLSGQPEPPVDDRFWQRYVSPVALKLVLEQSGFTDVDFAPAIFGLPIFWRGTCQYPLVPKFAEPACMWTFEQGRKMAMRLPVGLRRLSLIFSESYVMSATKR